MCIFLGRCKLTGRHGLEGGVNQYSIIAAVAAAAASETVAAVASPFGLFF